MNALDELQEDEADQSSTVGPLTRDQRGAWESMRNRARRRAAVVLRETARYYEVDVPTIRDGNRQGRALRARYVALFLVRQVRWPLREGHGHIPAAEAARLVGRDHTSVLHAWKRIHDMAAKDPRLVREIADVRAEIVRVFAEEHAADVAACATLRGNVTR